MSSASVYSDEWEVRKSIVRLNRDKTEEIQGLKDKGFHVIEELEEVGHNDDVIVLGRHQLAPDGKAPDSESSDFRIRPGDEAAVGLTSSLASLRSVAKDAKSSKKQKTSS
mmetsp:Transcript_4235/g.8615  ORF Transcript_4235/g.8615 Transcript_4235/m.8615 type:complete len:110 (+) Transcript_4235:808-1137(+)|eukprot:scaffold1667_cov173-Amphora_coffeaeformis.AAC.34